MKKYSSIFILITSVLVLILGYFAYDEFIRPIYLNNNAQEKKILLNSDQRVVLIKRQEQSSIYGIELEISPNDENYTVGITENTILKSEAKVKNGKEFIYKTDWQKDTCFLIFTPHEKAGDSITITYRFLGLNK